jgi:tetratricopeptide (TPR) repeat protein
MAEPDVVAELISHCARLPLALAIVAARAALNPRLPLGMLADELRDEQVQLDALDAGDPATSVRAVFSYSYQQLSAPAARMFRLLGVHPGPDISLPAAASLVGIPLRQAREAIAELTRTHLLSQPAPGRFAFHDLLRAYATEQAHALDPEVEREAALLRLLDHYLHTAHTAALLLYPAWAPIALAPLPPQAGVTPEKLPSYGQAWAWFEAEYPVLLAAIQLAAATGQTTHACQLPWTLREFFERRGHWHDWATSQHTALEAAQQSADRRGQANAQRSLGRACSWLGRYDEAHAHAQQALDLFEKLSDEVGQANSHIALGVVFEHQGRPEEALPHAQQALTLSRAAGYRLGQAMALNDIGWSHTLLGDPQQALTHCLQSLALRRDLGDRRGEARTLDSIGYAHHHLGHHEQAIAYYQQSLILKRELDDRHSQATTLSHLGETHHETGNLDAARDAWQGALDILDHLGLATHAGLGAGYPDPDELRAKLADLDRARRS